MRLGRASAYGMLAMMSIARASSESPQPSKSTGRRPATNGNGNGNGHGHDHVVRREIPHARAQQISQKTGIPVEYLRKVLQRLTRARLVASERGRSGGFKLARPASKITLLHIVEAIEGPVDEAAFLGDGLLDRPRGEKGFPRLKAWRRGATEGVRDLLDAQSLEDLME